MIDEELPKRAQKSRHKPQTVAPRSPMRRFRPSEACFMRGTTRPHHDEQVGAILAFSHRTFLSKTWIDKMRAIPVMVLMAWIAVSALLGCNVPPPPTPASYWEIENEFPATDSVIIVTAESQLPEGSILVGKNRINAFQQGPVIADVLGTLQPGDILTLTPEDAVEKARDYYEEGAKSIGADAILVRTAKLGALPWLDPVATMSSVRYMIVTYYFLVEAYRFPD